MKYCLLISFLFFVFIANSFAQSTANIKKNADQLLLTKEYQEALSLYEKIKDSNPKDFNLKYNIGKCYFHLNQFKNALIYFDFYAKNSPKPEPSIYYYLAKSYHLQNNFEAAAIHYKNYLKNLPSKSKERAVLKSNIMQCTNAAKITQIPSNAVVSTLGDKINTIYDEYRICFNPRFSNRLFFSSNRKGLIDGKLNSKNLSDNVDKIYQANIFQAVLIEGIWENAEPLSTRYNSTMNEHIISFFDNGYQMLLSKGYPNGQERVAKENFDEDSIEVLLPFGIGMSSNDWDGDYFFVNDSTVIFSSNRSGGYGGKDLYYALRISENLWQSPINLGASINSKYDEVSPFLAKDGRTLYFSSNLPLSMGGYDIYKAVFQDSTREFKNIQNLGVPINSAADDKDFFLDKDALGAYFSSNRIESLGGFDLYAAYFRTHQNEQVLGKMPKTFIDVLNSPFYLVNQDSSQKILNKWSSANNSNNSNIYNLNPIYYNAQTGAIEGSQNSLQTLSKLLIQYPEIVIVLTAHSDNTGDMVNDYFLTIKQAEEISKELLKTGVQPQQIWLRGCGQNYPVSTNKNFDGTPNPSGNTMNRRVNIDVYNTSDLQDKINIKITQPKVSSVMEDFAFERYQSKIKGLSYKVQITETTTLFNHPFLGETPPVCTEKLANDSNIKYLVGLEKTFAEIKKIQEKAIQKGFSKAQIIPYLNGTRISRAEAELLVNEYPDLKYLIKG